MCLIDFPMLVWPCFAVFKCSILFFTLVQGCCSSRLYYRPLDCRFLAVKDPTVGIQTAPSMNCCVVISFAIVISFRLPSGSLLVDQASVGNHGEVSSPAAGGHRWLPLWRGGLWQLHNQITVSVHVSCPKAFWHQSLQPPLAQAALCIYVQDCPAR